MTPTKHQRVARTLRSLARPFNRPLAHSIEESAALDARRQANLLDADLRSAAEVTTEDTKRATSAVRDAEAGAAEGVEREVTAPAELQQELLAAAEARDSRAELRDRVADERERAASLRPFLGDQQYEEYEAHARGRPVRRAAALDRFDAKTDRVSAASDRAKLRAHLPQGSDAWESMRVARMSAVAAELGHDLRSPLSSIIASVEMLEEQLRGHSDRSLAALLGSATRAGDRMVRMLDQSMTSPSTGERAALPEVDLAGH